METLESQTKFYKIHFKNKKNTIIYVITYL